MGFLKECRVTVVILGDDGSVPCYHCLKISVDACFAEIAVVRFFERHENRVRVVNSGDDLKLLASNSITDCLDKGARH